MPSSVVVLDYFAFVCVFGNCVLGIWRCAVNLLAQKDAGRTTATSRVCGTTQHVKTFIFILVMLIGSLIAWQRADLATLWLATSVIYALVLFTILWAMWFRREEFDDKVKHSVTSGRTSASQNVVRVAFSLLLLAVWSYSWRHLFWPTL